MTLNQSTFEQGLGQGPLALLVLVVQYFRKSNRSFLSVVKPLSLKCVLSRTRETRKSPSLEVFKTNWTKP